MAASVLRMIVALLLLAAAPLAARADALGLRDVEPRLHLDARQKLLFDDAVAATQRAMLATALVGMQMKVRIADELRKDYPDPRRLLADPDDIADQLRPQWREAHEAWSRLYATLDERQLAIARREIERRLGLLEGLGADALKGFADKLNP